MTSPQLQAALAVTLALGLHVGAFALRPAPAGASGSGADGAGTISLQAAGPAFTDMVAAWDAPPAIPADPTPPAVPQAESAPALPASADRAPDLPAPDLPSIAAATIAPASPDTPPQAAPAPAPPPPPAVKPKPRPPAKPTQPAAKQQPARSDSSAAQTAVGSGGAAVAGTDGTAPAPSLSQGQIADITATWGASIRARIEKRKRYPRAADGASGTVTVRLTISRSGTLASLGIVATSGNAALDEAAINAVRAAGKFPAAPQGLSESSYSFTLPMRFSR